MNVPAGEHEVVFEFDPDSLHATETIAYIAFVLLALAVLVAFFLEYKKCSK
jgi:hypothetical protein